MQSLKVVILDDEPLARDVIAYYCNKIPNIEIVASCSNAIDAAKVIKEKKVDVIFLDINMPELNGFQFLKTLSKLPDVIFTTAYSEFAVESYDYNAIDYLVKPISFERFLKAIQKTKNTSTNYTENKDSEESTMFVKSEGKLVRINLSELLFIEGLKDYVKFCMPDKKIIVHGSLKKSEDYLNSVSGKFIRVHKSYIVNSEKIKEIDSSQIILNHENQNYCIPFGSTYSETLDKIINSKRY
ncbi:MAG: response regulator transcription factor [Bacteroidetes bacterium]|jgi:DNA-binding LytR/AlgR family response regulator|nr:response regulator transcription factor [Bacteroidota bacterium]MCA6443200.1 response regulator transcription factor [Bacteroidota bacterium]